MERFFVFRWGARFPILELYGTENEVISFCKENKMQWARTYGPHYGSRDF